MRWPFAILPLLVAVPGAAFAEERDVKAAEAAYDEAEKLLERGQPAQACVRYADSYRLDPQLGALLHVADCNERIDKLATAWRAFEEGYRMAVQKGDERAAVARERADALRARLAYVRIHLPADAGADARVTLDGVFLDPALVGKDIPVDRGHHGIVVIGDGQEKWKTDVVVQGGPGVRYFDVPSWRVPPRSAGGRDAQKEWLGLDPSLRKILGWSAAGVGVAGLGLSTYFFVRQGAKASDAEEVERRYDACANCDHVATNAELDALADDQRGARLGGIVAGAAGTLFLAAGAVLLFVPPPASEKGAVPRVGVGFGSVSVSGHF